MTRVPTKKIGFRKECDSMFLILNNLSENNISMHSIFISENIMIFKGCSMCTHSIFVNSGFCLCKPLKIEYFFFNWMLSLVSKLDGKIEILTLQTLHSGSYNKPLLKWKDLFGLAISLCDLSEALVSSMKRLN